MPDRDGSWLWLGYVWRVVKKWYAWSWAGFLGLWGLQPLLPSWLARPMDKIPGVVWWIMAVTCVLLAQYRIWRDDHEAAEAKEERDKEKLSAVESELREHTDRETQVTGPVEYIGETESEPSRREASEGWVRHVKVVELEAIEIVEHFLIRCLSTAVPNSCVAAEYSQPGISVRHPAHIGYQGDAVHARFGPPVPVGETVWIRLAARAPIEGVRIAAHTTLEEDR